jgi:hypothetical protein
MSNNLSYDDVLRMWRTLPKFPAVKTSEFVPRGTGFWLAPSEYGPEMLVIHPDDLQEMLDRNAK